MFIPVPTCYRLLDQPYRLALEVWPLRPDSLNPQVEAEPVWRQSWAEPLITLRPTDSLLSNQPQTVDFWRADRRLGGPISLQLNETVSQLSYASEASSTTSLIGRHTGQEWLPLEPFITPLHLPCDEGPSPFATLTSFIAAAALPPDVYQPSPDLPGDLSFSLNNRLRTFAPLSATLSFSDTLSPLSIQLPTHRASVTNYQPTGQVLPIINLQSPISSLQSLRRHGRFPTSCQPHHACAGENGR
jgi:hypothetical protein